MRYYHNDIEWARNLEIGLDEYINDCLESVDNDDWTFETVTGEPFCGCSDCYTRETVLWLMPRIIDAYRAGIIEEDTDMPKLTEDSLHESFNYDTSRVFQDALSMLLKKHQDYGPKNISQSPGGPLNGLRVRMWDKMARINHLMDSGATPENESLRDSFLDLMNYAAIAQLVLDGNWPDE